jgi:DNA-binding transcriptional ArsR family regulator
MNEVGDRRQPDVQALVGSGLTGQMTSATGLAGGAITAHPTTGTLELGDPLPVRQITDVDTLRLLADPTRLAILRVLMSGAKLKPPIMSAKELAATLHEPQTKLYRHLKQLEDAQLIQIAETRLVSGIIEQRYRTGQLVIAMSPEMLSDPATRTAATEGIAAAVNDFRDELIGHILADRTRPTEETAILTAAGARIPARRAGELRDRLNAVIAEFTQAEFPQEEPAESVNAHMLIAWYETA